MRLPLHRNPVQRYQTHVIKTEGISMCNTSLQVQTGKYDQTTVVGAIFR